MAEKLLREEDLSELDRCLYQAARESHRIRIDYLDILISRTLAGHDTLSEFGEFKKYIREEGYQTEGIRSIVSDAVNNALCEEDNEGCKVSEEIRSSVVNIGVTRTAIGRRIGEIKKSHSLRAFDEKRRDEIRELHKKAAKKYELDHDDIVFPLFKALHDTNVHIEKQDTGS